MAHSDEFLNAIRNLDPDDTNVVPLGTPEEVPSEPTSERKQDEIQILRNVDDSGVVPFSQVIHNPAPEQSERVETDEEKENSEENENDEPPVGAFDASTNADASDPDPEHSEGEPEDREQNDDHEHNSEQTEKGEEGERETSEQSNGTDDETPEEDHPDEIKEPEEESEQEEDEEEEQEEKLEEEKEEKAGKEKEERRNKDKEEKEKEETEDDDEPSDVVGEPADQPEPSGVGSTFSEMLETVSTYSHRGLDSFLSVLPSGLRSFLLSVGRNDKQILLAGSFLIGLAFLWVFFQNPHTFVSLVIGSVLILGSTLLLFRTARR